MTYQCKQVDIGDKCVECLRSTSFGSGLFVNRIPADNDKYIGYLCPECNFFECEPAILPWKFAPVCGLFSFDFSDPEAG